VLDELAQPYDGLRVAGRQQFAKAELLEEYGRTPREIGVQQPVAFLLPVIAAYIGSTVAIIAPPG
jgi:hypothetical protein